MASLLQHGGQERQVKNGEYLGKDIFIKNLVEKNFRDYFETLKIMEDVEIIRGGFGGEGSLLTSTPIPFFFFNSFMGGSELRGEHIAQVKDFFVSKNLPFSLWFDSELASDEVLEACDEQGLVLLQLLKLVSYQSKEGHDKGAGPRHFKVKKVTTSQEFRRWLVPFMAGFAFPLALMEEFFFRWGVLNMERAPEQFLNFFIEEKGTTVAVVSAYMTGEFVGIYNMTTFEEFRRRGLGMDLALAMERYFHGQKVKYLGGFASDQGMELYSHFNIDILGTWQMRAFFNT